MKTRVLVDSCFCIFGAREFGNPFRLFALHRQNYEFATCGRVMVEVLRGLKEPKVVEAWRREFDRLTYLPTKRTTWRLIQKLVWDFERAGRRLDMQDTIIAACALEAGAAVLTLDKRFSEITGLRVISGL